MAQYFDARPSAVSELREVNIMVDGRAYRLWSDNGVFAKRGLDIGTSVFLECLLKKAELRSELESVKGRALDLGCGIGIIAIVLQGYLPQLKFSAVDINERAVSLAKRNVQASGLDIPVHVSDGFSALKEEEFSLIVSNPPIRIGKQPLYRLIADAYAHLAPCGLMFLVVGKKQGAESLQKYCAELAGDCDSVGHASGFKVLRLRKAEEVIYG